jgi:diguanylate cyclase (GGDEF)-like protein
MKTSTATSIGALTLATATTAAAVLSNLRLRRTLSATRDQLGETQEQLGEAQSRESHDALTGVANRRGIEAALAERMASGDSWALVLVDLDGFKLVNDMYGHAAGDVVLAGTARRLSTVVDPAADLVGRLGGDEFVILAASPIPAISRMLARDAVAVLGEPFTVDGDVRVGVTASVGLVQVMPGDDPRAVMRSADAALYRAKAAGGNTAVEFGPGEPLVTVDVERPQLRVRDMHPHRVPSELGVVIAR